MMPSDGLESPPTRVSSSSLPQCTLLLQGNHLHLIVDSVRSQSFTFCLLTDPEVGCWTVMDVHKDLIVALCGSPNRPNYLVGIWHRAIIFTNAGYSIASLT